MLVNVFNEQITTFENIPLLRREVVVHGDGKYFYRAVALWKDEISDEKHEKSLAQVIVCLRKIQRSLSCNFSSRTPWRILSRKARSRELRQKLWTYHRLCITSKETDLYQSSSQKKGFSFEPIINTDSFTFITTKKQCRWFITLMYRNNI